MTKSASAEVQGPEGSAEKPGASPLIVSLIALCAGITVSNLYLTQPLLPLVAESLKVSSSQVGFLPTIGQAGYALGILLIVPLGDVLRRRGLLTCGLFTSRSLYGQVGDAFGWRASYVVAAVLSAIIGTITISVLPKEKSKGARPTRDS